MADPTSEEIEQKVLHYLGTVDKVKARGVAKTLNMEKHMVDNAIHTLAKADKIEYLYLDTVYIKLKGK
ncbi:MAG: hypothetical protein ABIH70_03910 [Chloroflexota bacterium]